MKLVLVFAVIFASLMVVSSTILTSRLLNNDKVMRYVNQNSNFLDSYAAQMESWCPSLPEKLKGPIKSLIACDALIPNSKTFCEALESHDVLKCLRPVIKAVSECFPEKSKDLPELVVKSWISIANYLCKQDGEHILELSDTCAYDFKVFNQDPIVKECFRGLQKKIELIQENGYPVKSEVCSFGNEMKNCFKIHINQACKNEKARSIHLGVQEASFKVCST